MKITETTTRDCCTSKDLKSVEGAKKLHDRYPMVAFCVHCGARHKVYTFTDAAGSSDWEYRKEKEA